MQDLSSIIEKLKLFNLSEVSRKTGIKYDTLYAIASGKTPNPTYKNIKLLDDFLKSIAEEIGG